jgi:hypothetical protein
MLGEVAVARREQVADAIREGCFGRWPPPRARAASRRRLEVPDRMKRPGAPYSTMSSQGWGSGASS